MVSAVKVNNMHLPLVEYKVDGKVYKTRIPYNIATSMEKKCKDEKEFVRANYNFGTHIKGQLTKLKGKRVKLRYNPEKPKQEIIIVFD